MSGVPPLGKPHTETIELKTIHSKSEPKLNNSAPRNTHDYDLYQRCFLRLDNKDQQSTNKMGINPRLTAPNGCSEPHYTSKFNYSLNLAKEGCAEEQYNLSFMYAHGQGVEIDMDSAVNWLKISIDEGFVPEKGNLYCPDIHNQKNTQGAGHTVYTAAEKCAEKGLFLESLYLQAAALGSIEAHSQAVRIQKSCLEKLIKSANEGDSEAQFQLGLKYLDGKKGLEIPQNYAQALTYFEKAEEQNHSQAPYYAGLLHTLGYGEDTDYNKATVHLKQVTDPELANKKITLLAILSAPRNIEDIEGIIKFAGIKGIIEAAGIKNITKAHGIEIF